MDLIRTKESKGISAWIEIGYDLLAHEGPEGLQIERLARILQRNKSGFYHYFGDSETYFEHLIKHHHKNAELFIADIKGASNIVPECLNLMLKHRLVTMVNMQLIRNKHIKLFKEANIEISNKISLAILPAWSSFLGLQSKPELAQRYFHVVRDSLHSRMPHHDYNYDFYYQLAMEAKAIVDQLQSVGPAAVGESR